VDEEGQAGQAGARTGCEGLVHPREAEQIRLGILGRHPSLKDTRHTDTPREQIAIRRRLRSNLVCAWRLAFTSEGLVPENPLSAPNY
jgi:hypothetical protein